MAKSTKGIARAHALRAIAVGMAGLGLAACSAADFISPAPTNRVGAGVEVQTNEPMEPTRARVEPDYIPTTDELIGIGEGEAVGYFGEPSLRRIDQDAQIWQYGAEACVLFLFFYPDTDETPRVSYVTSSGPRNGEDSPGDQACVDAVTRDAANTMPMS